MRPFRGVPLLLCCFFPLIAAACGGDSTPAPTPDDGLAAKSALLAVSDFPAGWTLADAARSGSSPLEKCRDAKTGKNQTGEAESGSFGNGPASVRQTVLVYRTSSDALAAMNSLANELGCAVNLMNTGKAETDEASVSGAVAGTVPAPVVGDRTNAYRIKFHLTVKASKAEADGYIDVVYVQSGRAIVGLVASNAYEPLAGDVLNPLTSKAAAKLPK